MMKGKYQKAPEMVKEASEQRENRRICMESGKIRLKYMLIGAVLLIAVIVGVFLKARRSSLVEEPLYLAVVGPMTGDDVLYGESFTRGIQLYLDQINREGGIEVVQNGEVKRRRVELMVFDDRNDPELARQRALEIVESQALAVIGHHDNACSLAGGEVYQQHGIPAITPASTAVEVTQNNPWYFRTIYNAEFQGRFLALFLKEELFILPPDQQGPPQSEQSSQSQSTAMSGRQGPPLSEQSGQSQPTAMSGRQGPPQSKQSNQSQPSAMSGRQGPPQSGQSNQSQPPTPIMMSGQQPGQNNQSQSPSQLMPNRQPGIYIVYEDTNYGSDFAQSFQQALEDLQVSTEALLSFRLYETQNEQEEERVRILHELQEKREPQFILIATRDLQGLKLVQSVRTVFPRIRVIVPEAFATRTFQQRFQQSIQEKQQTDFLNDVLVTTPLTFDATNEQGQVFRDAYKTRYREEPDWPAAYAYDAALVLLSALETKDIQGTQETLHQDRTMIREYLGNLSEIEDAVEGATGFNYFDDDGDLVKSVFIGEFRGTQIILNQTQFQLIPNINDYPGLQSAFNRKSVIKFAESFGKDILGERQYNDLYLSRTHVIHTGVEIQEISAVDMTTLTCTIDFFLWFRFLGEDFGVQNIDFLNAVDSIVLEDGLIEEVEDGQLHYRLYHLKGRFKADFIPEQYAFEQHVLGFSFFHEGFPQSTLIYVTDILGMNLTREESLLAQMKANHILDPASIWNMTRVGFFQNTIAKAPRGKPGFLLSTKGTFDYSRFNAVIWIKRQSFSIRTLLFTVAEWFSEEIWYGLAMLSSVLLVLLMLIRSQGNRGHLSASLWLFRAMVAFLLLLTAEVAVRYSLPEPADPYHLALTSLIFDTLWWAVPAMLLVSAIDQFIWNPLEKRTGRIISKLARNFLAFVVYLLAFFGIVAFVFDQRLTGLLATSGVFAMIIGLAVQMNISNIFSGLAINLEAPFHVGDWVKIGDDEGKVADMTWRTTRIQTMMGNILSIPNSAAAESLVTNYSYPSEEYWLTFTLETVPLDPPEAIRKILFEAALAVRDVLRDPPPFIEFKGQGDSSAIFTVWFKVRDYEKKYQHMSAVWNSVWMHLVRASVELATPCRFHYEFEGQDPPNMKSLEPLSMLQEMPLLQPLPAELVSQIHEQMQHRRFAPGDAIVRQDEHGESLFIIAEGVVDIWMYREGKQAVTVGCLSAGDYFGEMSLLTGEPRIASIIAVTDVLVFEITKTVMAPILQVHPEVVSALTNVMAQRRVSSQQTLTAQKAEKNEFASQLFDRIKQFFGLTT